MLTKLIVTLFGGLIEVILWLTLLGAMIAGWMGNGFLGAVAALAGAFVFEVIVFGSLLILIDIRNAVQNLEKSKAGGVQTEN